MKIKPLYLCILLFLTYVSDQITKFWAVAALGDAEGNPIGKTISVIGEAFRFQLAYNTGAAFSMKPQKILPFLNPTVFYVLISLAAITGLYFFFKSLAPEDWASRLGVTLIFSGAIGNLSDRIRIEKVVDFIDWDFPDFQLGTWGLERWPTFNLADSWVLIGVALIFSSQWLVKKV